MKKSNYLVIIIAVLLFASALPVQARGRGHFSRHSHSSHIGVWFGPGWGPWWGATAYPYYYDYYWRPPVVTQEESPVYIDPTPQVEEQSYWYFCPDSRNYYPYVKQCPNGWLKVVPPSAPPDYRE